MNALCIGPDTCITVLDVKGNQVRLGIRAPKDVVVDRKEVHQREAAAALLPSSRVL